MQNLNQLVTHAVKNSNIRVNVFAYMGLNGSKNWYTRRYLWSVNKKERVRETPIWQKS